jgi:hypothetical protein
MKVFVDNRESGPLTQKQWREARKLLLGHPASGRVMNLDEACQSQRRMGMAIGAVLLACCWILALIFAIVGSVDGMIGLFAGGVLSWLAIYLGVWLSVSIGRAGLAERYRGGLPEPGVLVKADEAGLSIGERAAAWTDIALAAMRLRTDCDGEYILERLKLARAFEGVDLDLDLIEKGRAVVGYAFLRLCPEPPAGGA